MLSIIQNKPFYWGLYCLLKSLIISILISVAIIVVLIAFTPNGLKNKFEIELSYMVMHLSMIYFSSRFLKVSIEWKNEIKLPTSTILIFLAYFFLLQALFFVIEQFIHLPSLTMDEFNKDIDSNNIFFIINAIIVGPVIEEILFRGVYLKYFLNHAKKFNAMFFSSLFFAVLHISPDQMFQTFIAGFFLSYVYIKSNSLFWPIFFHVANNLYVYINIKYM
jgi:uncharacterized protein